MFFCVLFISTSNIPSSDLNYLNNQFYRNLYNAANTTENTLQNRIFKNLLCNDKMKTEYQADSKRNQSTNKFCLYSDSRYEKQEQNTYKKNNFFILLNKDKKEPSQSTESAISFDRDCLTKISANQIFKNKGKDIPQYCNDILSATDITKKKLSMTKNNNFATQSNMFCDLSLPKQANSILTNQEDESLSKQLIPSCTDKFIGPNNKKHDDIVIENDLFKDIDIDRYINWEPSEYDDKKIIFQQFDFEHNNNNKSVDFDLIHYASDNYAGERKKEFGEYNNINNNKFFNNDDLNPNDTKEQERRNTDFKLDKNTSKSFSPKCSNSVLFDILNKNKKELQALKDKFFVDIKKQSNKCQTYPNLTVNSKHRKIREKISNHLKWFNTFATVTFTPLMRDIETLYLPENTKKLLCEWVEFLKEVAQFINNSKSYVYVQKFKQCDFIGDLTLIINIIKRMILKFKFDEFKNLLQQIIQKRINPMFFDSKVEQILSQILCNMQMFIKKLKHYNTNITKLKELISKF
ncbi:hypothetical protein AAJ76_820006938 [Vairimorpha ceranae]|uniref:Uncharacterized protein n=1 Tax=Vairimorpha ceranae TaxID=40302 RepID=A0A0F9Z912_9MICR|nr:hypothetical protein AAJ76_820006938 [Vairimorpha ceranae]KKO74329.1 hypothetical protein AAJ76_820006938 [Vairimorpha ceranae]